MSYKTLAVAALLAGCAASGQAAVSTSFSAGTFGFQAGDTPVNDFSSCTGLALTGAGTGCYTGLVDGVAAPPAGDTTQYLAVLGGGTAAFTFADAKSISFDVGSVDDFNTLTLSLLGTMGRTVLTGAQINGSAATGNQFSPLTNGRLTIFGTGNELFTGITLSSSQNSLEIDNLSVRSAVPDGSTWAMFLTGFGALGGLSRYGKRRTSPSGDRGTPGKANIVA